MRSAQLRDDFAFPNLPRFSLPSRLYLLPTTFPRLPATTPRHRQLACDVLLIRPRQNVSISRAKGRGEGEERERVGEGGGGDVERFLRGGGGLRPR